MTLTAGGTAVASSDYLAFTLTPQIPAGQSSVTITVTPINDTQVEGPETVVLTVQDTVAYNLGPAGTETATVTIADQPTPVITIAATVRERCVGGGAGSRDLHDHEGGETPPSR